MMRVGSKVAAVWLALTLSYSWSFSMVSTVGRIIRPHDTARMFETILSARSSNDEEGNESESNGIPQLPAFSTFKIKPSSAAEKAGPTFASSKFEIQYTCKVCDTRNSHRVSRVAYREGVVITKCKGCDANHMLADNLGWGAFHEGETNIEEYLKGKGMEASRVSPEVFDLEKVLGIDSNSGSLVGDDGTPVLE